MFTFWCYRFLTNVLGPLLPFILLVRQFKGKEERLRRGERKGVPSIGRPDGRLIWVHVASVGESLSVLPLIGRILETSPDAHILVTGTTVTSATVMAKRLPGRAFHQFIPVDRPSWVRAFYDHWDPDLCLIVESELWPNLLSEAKKRQKPCVLINGRMSERSAGRWRKMSGFIRYLLDCFDLCLVQDPEQVERYKSLGAKRVVAAGNLKLVDNRQKQNKGRDGTDSGPEGIHPGDRTVWLAASTHEGEDALVIELHQRLIGMFSGVLTVIAPRHPKRRNRIIAMLTDLNIPFVTRTSGATVEPLHQVFLLDTIGELTDFYNLSDISLICGSLVPGIGGHNPVEAAQRDTAVVIGPYVDNFKVLTRDFLQAGAARQAFTRDEVFDELVTLIRDKTARTEQIANARAFLARHANVLDSILSHLKVYLPQTKGPETGPQKTQETIRNPNLPDQTEQESRVTAFPVGERSRVKP